MSKVEIILGRKYRDRITGAEGVATSKTEWLTSCTRVGLEALKDGAVNVEYFDDMRLELVDRKPIVEFVAVDKSAPTGGDGPVPPSRDPVR